MCGSLRLEGFEKKIGVTIPIITNKNEHLDVQWLGHHRSENPKDPPNSERVRVLTSAYTEKEVEFPVPEGQCIEGLLVKHKNFPNGTGLFIVTRPATKEELTKCKHPRHPVFVSKNQNVS